MHEVGLIEEVIEIVCRRTGNARVRRVVLEIGSLAAVLPDAMRFAFEVCREGTPLEEATLDIVEIGARARCCACGAEVIQPPTSWSSAPHADPSARSGSGYGVPAARCLPETSETGSSAMSLCLALGRCPCGSCNLDWLSGEELRIREVEVA